MNGLPHANRLLLAIALAGCSGATSETPATSTTANTAPAEAAPGSDPPSSASASAASASAAEPTSPSAATPAVRISAPACGYGGSATAVVVFLDVETDVPLRGLTANLVASDPRTGSRVGGSTEPRMLLLSPVERGLLDFSTSGTTPFSGALEAGARTRLQFFSGLDGTPPTMGGIDIAMTLTAADGQRFDVACATEGMWPSS